VRIKKLVVGPLQTNCYIVADSDGEAIIIDPGGDAERIEKTIESHELTPRWILCTHGHPDHTYAAGRLQSSYDIELLVHAKDRPMVEAGLGELAFVFDTRGYQKPIIGPAIEDGQTIKVGSLVFYAAHTPGHTPGGMSFVGGHDVFTGDTLFACGIGRTDLPGGSASTLLHSIEKRLFVLNDETRVHPGHGDETTIGEEKRDNPWLRKPESEE
jgi:hydroxyacylglutathione hydrolase